MHPTTMSAFVRGLLPGMLLATVTTAAALAQPGNPSDSTDLLSPDSTKMYRLGSVTVTDRRVSGAEPINRDVVRMPEINRADATNVAGIMYEVPSARVQTNSRGESILYLRNAGERQVGIFMDGALLNVPWDNRIDLSLVPMNAVGGLVVEKGTPSVLYGANVMGGAVNVATRELGSRGHLTEITGGLGQFGYGSASATHLGNTGNFNYIGAVSYSQRDGYGVPEDADLPFSQSDPDLRTNTDSRIASAYLRGEYHVSDVNAIGLSINVADAEKGVAPESNVDPEVDGVRYWRYPEWRNMNITGTYDFSFGEYDLWNLRGALWTTLFHQRIEQYESAAYESVAEAQEDDDATLGFRGILSRRFEKGALRFSVNELYSTHEQVDSEFDSNGTETADPLQNYAQQTFSIGTEYETEISQALNTVLGASVDGMITEEAGDKPAQDPFIAPGLTAGAIYAVSEVTSFRASLARKTRFPSMRELYGEALNRFLVNTDLEPESSWNGELGYIGSFRDARFELAAFTQLTSNTIDQRRVDTMGSTKRQRINLPGSRIFGVELSGNVTALKPFRVNGHLMWSYVRGITELEDGSDSLVYLAEKPEALGTLNLGYDFDFGLILDAEAVYTGTAYGPGGDSQATLDASLALNARVAYRLFEPFNGLRMLEIFARGDNLTDAVVLPQEGLPSAGREFRGGIKLAL